MPHKTLPDGLTKYAETPIFTEATVPAKLTANHSTKAGTWGKLIVLDGSLDYIIPGSPGTAQTLPPETIGVIEPEILHHVKITGSVKFKVEFWK